MLRTGLVTGVLVGFGGCTNDRGVPAADPTTVDTQASTSASVTSIAQTTITSMAEPNCDAHRPEGFPTIVAMRGATVGDVRAIRVGTLPPQPTDVLLPSYSVDAPAVLCKATDGGSSFAYYWVALGGEVGNICTVTYGDGAEPPEAAFDICP